jgi:redox-sensitive bicupin YhaK (pirin superfamily)
MSQKIVIRQFPIDFQWPTQDPFLFCAYHYDLYPKANEALGPAEPLTGRQLGQDFVVKNGYRMYHGEAVPGFPVHPHRGFETITLVRKGFVDHADSLGAAGRYGTGDIQWMTAGAGIQHSEMFPLLDQEQDNHLELLQIWINLPKKNKMTPSGYKMFWSEQIPRLQHDQHRVHIDVIAGNFGSIHALTPPEASWASDKENEVAVWVIEMAPQGRVTLPSSTNAVTRTLYFYEGDRVACGGTPLSVMNGAELVAQASCEIVNTSEKSAKILILQGKAIREPTVQYGPFVMNSQAEIMQTMQDYQRTRFGGWPWDRDDMVHGTEKVRFGRHSDGKMEFPGKS